MHWIQCTGIIIFKENRGKYKNKIKEIIKFSTSFYPYYKSKKTMEKLLKSTPKNLSIKSTIWKSLILKPNHYSNLSSIFSGLGLPSELDSKKSVNSVVLTFFKRLFPKLHKIQNSIKLISFLLFWSISLQWPEISTFWKTNLKILTKPLIVKKSVNVFLVLKDYFSR